MPPTRRFVGATDLGNFSTYSPNPANPLPPSTPQSWVISGDIGARPYVLEWPGGQDTPGSRSLPDGATDVSGENHVPVGSGDVGPDGEIPTLYYNFQTVYGYIGNTPMSNLITAAQEQRVRDCFSLFTQYFGVQFVETANQGATIATGDLRVFGSDTPTGAGSAGGHGRHRLQQQPVGGHQQFLQLGERRVWRVVHEHRDA